VFKEESLKNIFIVTGELSGDHTAAWYVKKLQQQQQGGEVKFSAVGGDNLASLGVTIYQRFEKLNVVGIVEIARHLPFILRFLDELTKYILNNKFDEVILVDFPGFNLRLAKSLKLADPKIKITYLAPPQMWCWGAWRAKKIKKYCDKVIVLYPFEVEWYKRRGIQAQWHGNPVYDKLKPYFDLSQQKEKWVALVPGSRKNEIESFLPICSQVIKFFSSRYTNVKFVIPIASSLPEDFIEQQFKKNSLDINNQRLILVRSDDEKYRMLCKCCLAITKPGTVTLELALLRVPAVMFFKISWLTYLLARPLVKVKYMSLPNLLLDAPVYKELVQSDCKIERIIKEADNLFYGFVKQTNDYVMKMNKLEELRKILG
jgi:lipid-A-disaccharide synthase